LKKVAAFYIIPYLTQIEAQYFAVNFIYFYATVLTSDRLSDGVVVAFTVIT